MTKYKALTYLNLPPDNRKAPGDSISDKELKDAGQDEESIKVLLDSKAIGGPDDEIDKAHAVSEAPPNPSADVNVTDGETGGE